MKVYFINLIYGYLRRNLWTNWKLRVRKIPESHIKWTNIIMETYFGRCPSGLSFGPTFFLIYINDLPNGLKTNAKFFADGTSLFTIFKDKNESKYWRTDQIKFVEDSLWKIWIWSLKVHSWILCPKWKCQCS